MTRPRFPNKAWRLYWLWHPLQGALLGLLFALLKALPADAASGLGGRLGRLVGPRLGTPTSRARRNLALAFPEKPAEDRQAILEAMWEHLGRTAAEYPHLLRIRDSDRIEISGADHIRGVLEAGGPVLFFSGHIGHWELAPMVGAKFGVELTAVYRPPNNRFVDTVTRRIREQAGLHLLSRGRDSARAAMGVLQQGRNLALLADQRRMYGIPVPFFGHEAMTGQALAQLALRFGCPVVPVRVERLAGCRFRIHGEPPLRFSRTGDRRADTLAAMTAVNAILERWIRERPEQWLWPHRRWDR